MRSPTPHAAAADRGMGRQPADPAPAAAPRDALEDGRDRTGDAELWVRVYPDDVAVTTHEKVLTDAEVTHGQRVLERRRSRGDRRRCARQPLGGARRTAWRQPRRVGGARRRAGQLGRRCGRRIAALRSVPGAPVTKPDAWTEAPHTRVLPDRFVLLAWRGGVACDAGRPADRRRRRPRAVADRRHPRATRRSRAIRVDSTLALGDRFRWVRDFDAAVEKRHGVPRAGRRPTMSRNGFDRLLVLGVKLSADADDAQALVEDLIDDHHYSRAGFELLRRARRPTTPTATTPATRVAAGRASRGVSRDGPAALHAGRRSRGRDRRPATRPTSSASRTRRSCMPTAPTAPTTPKRWR